MTLPEIPDEAWHAMRAPVPGLTGLESAWPHLYAAALRHAADDERMADSQAVLLRHMADEASP
jgi:hypothetical protein